MSDRLLVENSVPIVQVDLGDGKVDAVAISGEFAFTSPVTTIPGGVSGVARASAVTAGVTALSLPATALADRKALYVFNNGSVRIYVGGSGVTTSTGIPVRPGTGQGFDADDSCLLYAISGTAGQNVRVLELS